ncbi:MAG: DUF1553 domain-containing protein [Planctomycetes bacterium]|nr:DUF1553 domain-containing protein [Planctomycetota bacterium]
MSSRRAQITPAARSFTATAARAALVALAATGAPAAAAGAGGAGADAATVDFNRDVRPLLTDRCLKCHGGVKQESGLSLLYRHTATAPAASKRAAIVPGKPGESELIRRVTAADPDDRMPPKGNPLPAGQVETLRRWIAAGAPYDEHWAYRKPRDRPLPEAKDPRHAPWPRNGMDRFVLQRLEEKGLSPSPEADPCMLARRVSLDLTGLPPSLEDVEAFAAAPTEEAYERLVDRLLASPHYGERWARLWLDLARYADTQGYEKDNQRTIWRFRDWVVQAFNQDMPFDRLTLEQLAGDLLPEPTLEQRIATAFHRNTMTNTEGGTDDEEFRVAAVVDRVNTTWQVWMGTSFGCVQCHSHPYDPFRHEEYYRFFAFFNQTEDNDQPGEEPVVSSPTPEQGALAGRLKAQIAGLQAKLDASTPELEEAQAAWEASMQGATEWRVLKPSSAASSGGATLKVLDDGSVLASGERPANDAYTVAGPLELARVAAIRLEALPDPSLPKGGAGRADDGNFVLSRVAAALLPGGGRSVPPGDAPSVPPGGARSVTLAGAAADHSQDGFPAAHAIAGPDPKKNGWAVAPRQAEPHRAVFAAAEPVEAGAGPSLRVVLEHLYERPGFTLGRFRISFTSDPLALERFLAPEAVLAALKKAPDGRTAEEKTLLAKHHRSIAPALKPARDELARLEAELKAIPIPTTPVFRELPAEKRRQTRVFIRGSFLAKGDAVEQGVPRSMHPFPEGAPRDRFGVARWLTSPENPLTARVLANRLWEQLFGAGIVETSEDFGTQGAAPSHPELLDWLAVRLMDRHRWSLKSFLKEVAMSATYRQTSAATPARLEADPQNRLLGRGPRFRLEAEMVRDQALATSGLLSRKLFGPSVMPPQPDGVWQVVYSGDQWTTSAGEDKHRRGLYTFWRRTSPYPSMITFDATSREACTLRRMRTNTPLQALVTLNDPVYVEAAQALARRIVSEASPPTPEALAARGLRLALLRPPRPGEVERLAALYRGTLEDYKMDPDGARSMATDPLGPAPEGADLAELAAWTVVSNVLLNLDEYLSRG